ncbi:hypothetical protein N2152v2_001091 [Parachlorella kessleri]
MVAVQQAPEPSTNYAGPFVRYQNVTGNHDRWLGSVLFLTKGADSQTNGSNAKGVAAGASGAQPKLVLQGTDSQSSSNTPTLLDVCEGWHFWRFELDLELSSHQRPVQYSVEWAGGSTEQFTFFLPGVGQSFHAGYYSCNGFSSDVKEDVPERKDPAYLWRDLLELHASFPMHLLIGGGDQLYSDPVWQTPTLREWADKESRHEKLQAPWTDAMEHDAVTFYLRNYINCFMAPTVRLAFASIPSAMMWDDHDIYDGAGSYEEEIQGCPVFKNLFIIAKRFYLLFQQHTTRDFNEQQREFFGEMGEYHFIKYMGPEVALVGVDMRSRRSKKSTFDAVEREVLALPESVRHIIVMSGVPLVFPRLPLAESILEGVAYFSKASRLLRKVARSTGLMDPNVGSQPEILDDLVDGWAADVHAEERLKFIRLLQTFAEQRGFRVTILSGDAHVGGVGQLYSHPKFKDLSQDPLYMPQIISSAIVNAPPPHPVIRMMVRTNFAKNVDHRTREKLVRLFKNRHPKFHKLLGQRNWCDISLMNPPAAPPMHPDDPQFGALRFSLRCENPEAKRGHADEVYDVYVPRLRPKQPPQRKVQAAAPAGVPYPGKAAAAAEIEVPAAAAEAGQPTQAKPLAAATAASSVAAAPSGGATSAAGEGVNGQGTLPPSSGLPAAAATGVAGGGQGPEHDGHPPPHLVQSARVGVSKAGVGTPPTPTVPAAPPMSAGVTGSVAEE